MTHMLSPEPTVAPSARITDSTLGAWTEIGAQTEIISSRVGDYSYLCDRCHVMFADIGKFCSIANHVRLNPGNHPIWRATQHHFTYRAARFGLGGDDETFFDWRKQHPVVLGHDVWLGHGVLVMPGVRIDTGAVVGSGAVVTKDVPPYVMVAGVPARPIKNRFPKDVHDALLTIAWWDWPHDALAAAMDDFRNPDIFTFVEKYR